MDGSPKKPRKAASLTMRMTQETRDALERTATKEGRSVSETAERWLDLAANGAAGLEKRLGGGGVSEALLAMADFAAEVRGQVGDPETQLVARDALLAGWTKMITAALPFTPDTAEGVAARMARVEAKAAARALLNVVLAASDDDINSAVAAWAFSPSPRRNALAQGPDRTVAQLLLDYDNATGADEMNTGDRLYAALRNAPAELASLSPSPCDVAETILTARERLAAYMGPRVAARKKGEALAEARVPSLSVG